MANKYYNNILGVELQRTWTVDQNWSALAAIDLQNTFIHQSCGQLTMTSLRGRTSTPATV